MSLIVAGDTKTPSDFHLQGATYLSVEAQTTSEFELAKVLPKGHYARKNIGYLRAMDDGASAIFETDDDNEPLPSWSLRTELVEAFDCVNQGWVNVYRHFTDEPVWPRGLPLESIRGPGVAPTLSSKVQRSMAPIQQALANGSPDVDAVWRLTQDRDIAFRTEPSVRLVPGAWCPFNSQSTWWFTEAFPLLYLPSLCSFRMTDIWRSFVAQRCLWELGHGVVFHGPEMHQDRNEHNLLRDFEQELPGYLNNASIKSLLENLSLSPGAEAVPANLRRCYEALVERGFVEAAELAMVDAWGADVARTRRNSR